MEFKTISDDVFGAMEKEQALKGEIDAVQELQNECYSWSGDGLNERQKCLDRAGDALGRYLNLLAKERRTR